MLRLKNWEGNNVVHFICMDVLDFICTEQELFGNCWMRTMNVRMTN